jgi:hypothetical protein
VLFVKVWGIILCLMEITFTSCKHRDEDFHDQCGPLKSFWFHYLTEHILKMSYRNRAKNVSFRLICYAGNYKIKIKLFIPATLRTGSRRSLVGMFRNEPNSENECTRMDRMDHPNNL